MEASTAAEAADENPVPVEGPRLEVPARLALEGQEVSAAVALVEALEEVPVALSTLDFS